MGCFYTGYAYKQRKNGYFKVGETSHSSPAQRLSSLRQEWGGFQCLGYLILKNESYAERLFIESYVRLKMSQEQGLIHCGNDYFKYLMTTNNKKADQAYSIADLAMHYAIEVCQMQNIEFTIGKRIYSR